MSVGLQRPTEDTASPGSAVARETVLEAKDTTKDNDKYLRYIGYEKDSLSPSRSDEDMKTPLERILEMKLRMSGNEVLLENQNKR